LEEFGENADAIALENADEGKGSEATKFFDVHEVIGTESPMIPLQCAFKIFKTICLG
jgi:hypothetical protein